MQRSFDITPKTAEEVNDCATPDGMRRRIRQYGWREDTMTRSILESSQIRGLSGEDTMTWLAFEALKRLEHLQDRELDRVMRDPAAPAIIMRGRD